MADVDIEAVANILANERDYIHGIFWTSPSVGYVVLISGAIDVRKTTDSGATWTIMDPDNDPPSATPRTLHAYFDQETPGNSGTLIHITWVDVVTNNLNYCVFDTADDTWGTVRVVDTYADVTGISTDTDVGITVSTSGRVYVCGRSNFTLDTENTDHSMRSSSDLFASDNVSEKSPYSADEEKVKLLPGSAADEDDICAVVFDGVNTDLEFWKFDASGNSWSKTAIDAGVLVTAAESRTYTQFFDAAIRHSDEHILVVWWNDFDTATADLKAADIAQATPTITAKTDIITDESESFMCGIQIINQSSGGAVDDVYVTYLSGTTWLANVKSVFKKSADDMGSWGGEVAYGIEDDDLTVVKLGHTVGDAGGRVMPVWFNDDLNDVTINDGNDIEIAAVTDTGNFSDVPNVVLSTDVVRVPDRMVLS